MRRGIIEDLLHAKEVPGCISAIRAFDIARQDECVRHDEYGEGPREPLHGVLQFVPDEEQRCVDQRHTRGVRVQMCEAEDGPGDQESQGEKNRNPEIGSFSIACAKEGKDRDDQRVFEDGDFN